MIKLKLYLKLLVQLQLQNLLLVFKIPDNKEDKLTKSKNGNVILVNSTAKLNFSRIFIKTWCYNINNKGSKNFNYYIKKYKKY